MWAAARETLIIIFIGTISLVPAIFIIVFGSLLSAPARLSSIFAPDQQEDEERVSVPTFYSIHDEGTVDDLTPFVATIIASIFGGVHCAGWFFTYPSHAEELIWRICSTFTAALPWPMIATKLLYDREEDDGDIVSCSCLSVILLIPVMIVCAMAYVVARLLLLGEAFAALRFLPPEARAVVQWVEFLPHI